MIIGMALIVNLLILPAMSLLPLLVKQRFEGGAEHLAALQTLFGIGLIGGGVLLGVWGGFKRRILTVQTGFMMLGIASLIIGGTGVLGLAMMGMFLIGVAATLINGAVQAIMQAVVEPGIQGRVFSLTTSAAAAVSPLGLLIAGPAADIVGVQGWYVLGGAACILFGIVGLFIPVLMNVENNSASGQVELTHSPEEGT